MKACESKVDSMINIIFKLDFSKAEQIVINDLLRLSINNISGDVYLKTKDLDRTLLLEVNKHISLSAIYDVESRYYKQIIRLKEFNSWASNVCRFIQNESIDYYNAQNIKVEATVFLSEIELYGFKNNDVVADIGAGSGYFELLLSKYCDSLVVFATDIDSQVLTHLETYLKFLELNDKRAITYKTVLGNEKSSQLPSNSFDKIMISNTFHHFSYPNEMLEDCKRILKKNGRLFIIDIMTDEVDPTPACTLHQTRQTFFNFLTASGFVLINEAKLDYDNFKLFEFQLAP
jgi:ubiquinone/menaquinone biosynthesis C-methylase UbiE